MMKQLNKKNYVHTCLLALSIIFLAGCKQESTLKVLQFNIWQEGTVVEGGFDGIVDNIVSLDPDLITFSEVRNYNGREFIPRLISELGKRGVTYYGKTSVSTGILSKYEIAKQEVIFPLNEDHGSVLKATIPVKGQTIILYSAHLDYTRYAPYLTRGYSGTTWEKLEAPVTDVDSILTVNRESLRDEAIRATIADVQKEKGKGTQIIIGGDFNEPSHLDWTEATKELFDHRGAVVPWDCSIMLYENGFKDAYRVIYPDPVTHPGFTFPADNKLIDVSKLTWTPEADERERIDFIYYLPNDRIQLQDIAVAGPSGSIVFNQRQEDTSEDRMIPPAGVWPTDHKAVIATFVLR